MEENFVSLNVEEFKKEIAEWNTVIDIRTAPELTRFWIIDKNQLHIDIYQPDAGEKLQKLDKTKKYIIYCYSWNRTKMMQGFMKNLGFEYVKDLDGGIDAWINSWEKVY